MLRVIVYILNRIADKAPEWPIRPGLQYMSMCADPSRTMPPRIDYSQYGQALLLQQLIADDTPTVLVDIGANDGICGSNSRALIEKGWGGVLLEPLPRPFEKLRLNTRAFPAVTLMRTAVSHDSGQAPLFIGRDGELGQMS